MKASHKQLRTGKIRRSNRARKPVQRLTGFEPLEPRTVLSAGMMMFGPGGFAEPHHDNFRDLDLPGRSGHGGGEYYNVPERQFRDDDGRYSPHDSSPRESIVIPYSSAPTQAPPPVASPVISAVASPISAPTSVETRLSPTLPVVTPYVPKASETATELVIIRTSATPRVDASSNQFLSISEYRPVVALPEMIFALAARRIESQPTYPISSVREGPGYVPPTRFTPANLTTAEAEASGATSEHGLSLRAGNSPALAQLSLAQSPPADRTDSSSSDESVRLDEHSDQAVRTRDTGDEDGELVEIGSGDLVRQKRKAALADAVTGAATSTRLERLADIPLAPDAQTFFRELARLFETPPAGATWLGEQTTATAMPDDGLVELLAADIGSLMLPQAVLPAGAPVAATKSTTLDAGVAVYQAFEIATGDAASVNDAAIQQVADRPVTETANQVARAE